MGPELRSGFARFPRGLVRRPLRTPRISASPKPGSHFGSVVLDVRGGSRDTYRRAIGIEIGCAPTQEMPSIVEEARARVRRRGPATSRLGARRRGRCRASSRRLAPEIGVEGRRDGIATSAEHIQHSGPEPRSGVGRSARGPVRPGASFGAVAPQTREGSRSPVAPRRAGPVGSSCGGSDVMGERTLRRFRAAAGNIWLSRSSIGVVGSARGETDRQLEGNSVTDGVLAGTHPGELLLPYEDGGPSGRRAVR
jgi:hypothetical protein